MIAIDITLVQANGNPFSYYDTLPVQNDNYTEIIEFFNSCIADSLILNTVIPFPDYFQAEEPYLSTTTRYYAINTTKATEFQERFMSLTAPFSMQKLWVAHEYDQSVAQTQIVFEDEPADQLVDLVDVNDNLLWGVVFPFEFD
jgi:hypothetical protein